MNTGPTSAVTTAELGDFTVDRRMLWIALIGIAIGALSCAVAWTLLKLIALFTNLFFFQTVDFVDRAPATHGLGALVIAVPVVGSLLIGLMARYGSERIRGHGIPEAIEAILLNGSRVEPKLAVLKPLSSAISIGSGGPFGAEGPIIMTGGAFGSLAAQLLHLTSSERKTLLVAGAAAGMSATFASPVAAVLLAFELLLFEWKPRSLVPVALASMTAAVLRHSWMGPGPLFPTAAHASFVGAEGALLAAAAGLAAGLLSVGLTASVYFFEDLFEKLPIHWMWWPALGGICVGLGGFVFPEALGVGYSTIGALLAGDVGMRVLIGVLIVKWAIWSIALGSGTSGGVLAPLLMIGGALGGIEASVLPGYGVGFWPMLSMAATLGGTMRSPFTAILFALELTHELNMLFPLMVAVFVSYGFTTMTMKRSILTEKVSRRGFHLSREYAIDPLEIMFVREVMRTNLSERAVLRIGRWAERHPIVASPDEPLRAVVNRMAAHGLTRLPVVRPGHPARIVGLVSLRELLLARARNLTDEHHRERTFRLRRTTEPT